MTAPRPVETPTLAHPERAALRVVRDGERAAPPAAAPGPSHPADWFPMAVLAPLGVLGVMGLLAHFLVPHVGKVGVVLLYAAIVAVPVYRHAVTARPDRHLVPWRRR